MKVTDLNWQTFWVLTSRLLWWKLASVPTSLLRAAERCHAAEENLGGWSSSIKAGFICWLSPESFTAIQGNRNRYIKAALFGATSRDIIFLTLWSA